MDNQLHMEDRLWNYIDGSGSEEERSVVERLLESDMAWKDKYRELLEVNQLLQSTELEQPSLRFTKNVMEDISKLYIAPATRSYINNKIIWGIGIFFIVMVTGFIIYGIAQVNWVSDGNTESPLAKNLDKVDFSKIFNNTWVNAFMMLNVILGLFLLDHYLGSKRKKMRKPI